MSLLMLKKNWRPGFRLPGVYPTAPFKLNKRNPINEELKGFWVPQVFDFDLVQGTEVSQYGANVTKHPDSWHCGDVSALDIEPGTSDKYSPLTGDCTYFIQFKVDTAFTSESIVFHRDGSATNGFAIYLRPSGNYYTIRGGLSLATVAPSSYVIEMGEVVNAFIVRKDGVITLYWRDAVIGTKWGSSSVYNRRAYAMTVGKGYNGAGNADPTVYAAGIWHRALSHEEVISLGENVYQGLEPRFSLGVSSQQAGGGGTTYNESLSFSKNIGLSVIEGLLLNEMLSFSHQGNLSLLESHTLKELLSFSKNMNFSLNHNMVMGESIGFSSLGGDGTDSQAIQYVDITLNQNHALTVAHRITASHSFTFDGSGDLSAIDSIIIPPSYKEWNDWTDVRWDEVDFVWNSQFNVESKSINARSGLEFSSSLAMADSVSFGNSTSLVIQGNVSMQESFNFGASLEFTSVDSTAQTDSIIFNTQIGVGVQESLIYEESITLSLISFMAGHAADSDLMHVYFPSILDIFVDYEVDLRNSITFSSISELLSIVRGVNYVSLLFGQVAAISPSALQTLYVHVNFTASLLLDARPLGWDGTENQIVTATTWTPEDSFDPPLWEPTED